VKRLIVDLPEEQRAALERLAHERRTTVSALILEAIDDRLRLFVTDEATPPSDGRAGVEERRPKP
jgi:predicted transcriptional regulator